MKKLNLNGFIKFFGLVALAALFIFTMQGCYNAASSNVRSPYGRSSTRQVCVAGNCHTVSNQRQYATVETRGYNQCVVSFTADNDAGLAICEAGVTGCRYSQVQIMDACTLRAGALNGSQFGMMPFGQFMPLYVGGYFSNPNAVASYSSYRQQALYNSGPQSMPATPQVLQGLSDEQLDEEAIRRAETRAAAQRTAQ